jgi:hypothetical protein
MRMLRVKRVLVPGYLQSWPGDATPNSHRPATGVGDHRTPGTPTTAQTPGHRLTHSLQEAAGTLHRIFAAHGGIR